ncbi:MAG: alpha/beta hydrolase family protein [Candidatus Acidiferrales bacterium]
MRPLEIALSLALVPPILLFLSPTRPESARTGWFSLLALVIAVLQLAIERYRWQMFPIYFVVVALVAYECIRWFRPVHPSYIAGLGCLCLLLGAVFMSTALPIFTLPALTGSYKVGTQVRHLVDETRRDPFSSNPNDPRELMIQIWYPADRAVRGTVAPYREKRSTTFRNSRWALVKTHSLLNVPVSNEQVHYPVLVFAPSWIGQRWENTFEAEDLASHGYIVIGMDHPYSSRATVFPDGRIIYQKPTAGEDYSSQAALDAFVKAAEVQVNVRTADARFVLDTLERLNQDDPGKLLTGKLDLNRAGIFGFSIGGAVAVQVCSLDPRFKAGINMDGMIVGESAEHGARRPFLFMMGADALPAAMDASSRNATERREIEFDNSQFALMKRSLAAYGGYWMVVPDTAHNDFSDSPFSSPLRMVSHSGSIDPEQMARIVNRYSLAMFNKYLNGQPEPLLDGPSPEFPEVHFQVWPVRNGSDEIANQTSVLQR